MSNVVFAREPMSSVWEEMQPLLVAHAAEIAHFKDIPLAPDEHIYRVAEHTGRLRAFTARLDGALVGYAVFFVGKSLHYSGSTQAQQDVIFIDKAHRGFGARFIAWCDEYLEAEGVEVVLHHLKAAHDWSAVLRRQGYELVDYIYAKRLR